MKKTLIVLNKGSKKQVPEILVYGDIDADMAASFARELKALEKTSKVINIRINSEGGSVYHGIAMFNLVRQSPAEIDIYIDGIAASMASAMAMAGRKVYMNKYARLMTHKPSGGAWGTAEDLRQVADEVEACETILKDMYVKKTGLSADEVSAKFLNGKDNFFSAAQAKSAGLIDDTYDGEAVEVEENEDVKALFNKFQVVLSAKLEGNNKGTFKTNNMKEVSLALWAKLTGALGIVDSANDAAVEKALGKIIDKANSYDTLKVTHEAIKAELETERAKVTTEKVNGLLDAAVTAKKITVEMKAQLGKDYATNPTGLKTLIDAMKAYEPITDKLKDGEVPAEYAGKSWDELMEAGKIGEIKANYPDFHKALFKKTFGKEPGNL